MKTIQDWSIEDLRVLYQDISGSILVIQSQLEVRGQENIDWWKRARGALGFSLEKKQIVASLIEQKSSGHLSMSVIDRLAKAAKQAREAFDNSDDLDSVVETIIKWMEHEVERATSPEWVGE